MLKLTIAALVGSAAAFAPAAKTASSTAISAKAKSAKARAVVVGYENELGVIAPTGFFDPLGLSKDIDQDTFDQYRTAELKHGRVAQLAVVGYVVPEFFRFPFDISPGIPCADVPNGVAALEAIPALGWAQIIFLIGAVDYWGYLGDFDAGKPKLDAAEFEKRQLNELQHGRIAMLAVLELLRHDSQNTVSAGFDGLDNLITGFPFLY
jgi:hypothetical protein